MRVCDCIRLMNSSATESATVIESDSDCIRLMSSGATESATVIESDKRPPERAESKHLCV